MTTLRILQHKFADYEIALTAESQVLEAECLSPAASSA